MSTNAITASRGPVAWRLESGPWADGDTETGRSPSQPFTGGSKIQGVPGRSARHPGDVARYADASWLPPWARADMIVAILSGGVS